MVVIGKPAGASAQCGERRLYFGMSSMTRNVNRIYVDHILQYEEVGYLLIFDYPRDSSQRAFNPQPRHTASVCLGDAQHDMRYS